MDKNHVIIKLDGITFVTFIYYNNDSCVIKIRYLSKNYFEIYFHGREMARRKRNDKKIFLVKLIVWGLSIVLSSIPIVILTVFAENKSFMKSIELSSIFMAAMVPLLFDITISNKFKTEVLSLLLFAVILILFVWNIIFYSAYNIMINTGNKDYIISSGYNIVMFAVTLVVGTVTMLKINTNLFEHKDKNDKQNRGRRI